MPRKITRELLDGFLIEVQDSLEIVGDRLRSLGQGEWEEAALEEAHRLAHSIKGAALMVRFPAVELIARLLEEVLEEGLTSEQVSQESVLATSLELWELLSRYLLGLKEKNLREETLLSDAVGAYCNHFPELEDEQMAGCRSRSILRSTRRVCNALERTRRPGALPRKTPDANDADDRHRPGDH